MSGITINDGLRLLLRHATAERRAIGLVIKRRSAKFYSERIGAWRGWNVGPFYIRTYKKRLGSDYAYDWYGIDARKIWAKADLEGWKPLGLPRPTDKGGAA